MRPHPVSLFDVAKRAVEIADPDAADARLSDLLVQFEDDDEPVTSIDNLEERVAIALEGIDVEIGDPAVSMAAAMILYLAHRRDELHDDPHKILRMDRARGVEGRSAGRRARLAGRSRRRALEPPARR